MADDWAKELLDVQTAMAIGELPHVEYCGLEEDAEGLRPNPYRWLLIVRGCGDDEGSWLPPLDDRERRLLVERNALFFGV